MPVEAVPVSSDGEGWRANVLVDSVPLVISNTSESDFLWRDLEFSKTVYDSDIRIRVTLTAKPEERYESSSLGIALDSHDFASNKDNVLSMVFQDGYWKLMHSID